MAIKGLSLIGAVGSAGAAHQTGGGITHPIEANNGDLYWVYIDGSADVVFVKSTDGGETWAAPVAVFTGTATALSVWFDRWSNISAGLIHCAYTESVTDDTFYRTINTESADALSTQTTVFAGSTTGAGGCLSIARARGGNVYCATMIDAGVEGGFFRLPNANVPDGAWDAARATVFEAAANDQIILMPGWAADNQDMMAFFWDADADEISRKLYDDSGDAWAETSIAGTMLDGAVSTAFPHFAAAVDITNSRNLLVAWSAVDAANQDLRCWHVTESAITEVTNVVANATDDCGLCGVGIDTDTQDWYVFYGGIETGSDTFNVGLSLSYKTSTDDGATWGSQVNFTGRMNTVTGLWMTPRFTTEKLAIAHGVGIYQWAFFDPQPAGSGLATPMYGGGIVA